MASGVACSFASSAIASMIRSRRTCASATGPELALEVVVLFFGHAVGAGVGVQRAVQERGRHRDVVGGGDLVDQLAAQPGVGFAPRLGLEVLAHRGAQRVDVLERSHFAGEVVGQGGDVLALDLVQRHAHAARLAAAGLVGVVIGEADRAFPGSAGIEEHDLRLEVGQGAALAEDEAHRLALLARRLVDVGDGGFDEVAFLRVALGGHPGRLLLAQLEQLGIHPARR